MAGNFRHFHAVNNAASERKTDKKRGIWLLREREKYKERGRESERSIEDAWMMAK